MVFASQNNVSYAAKQGSRGGREETPEEIGDGMGGQGVGCVDELSPFFVVARGTFVAA